MGLADRNYGQGRQRMTNGRSNITPVVKWLLLANIAIFLGDMLIFEQRLVKWGAFSIQSALLHGKVWEFLTFQFLHGSVLHVLFNSVGLYFFGPWMERWWGSRKFLVFYLWCGAGGAAFYTLLWGLGVLPNDGIHSGLIGASAGIYGILMGVAVIAPSLRVALVFPPIEMSMRQLAIVLLVISTGTILIGFGNNEGGEAGHLGGAIVGFALMRLPWLLKWADAAAPGVEIIRPRIFGGRPGSKLLPRTEIDLRAQTEVDRILDKISQQGFQSLTSAERATLQQVATTNPPAP
jgi:membrane associated rhomboid family serine protease